MREEENVIISKALLGDLLENTIDCYNSYESNFGESSSAKVILAKYQDEIDRVKKLLEVVSEL